MKNKILFIPLLLVVMFLFEKMEAQTFYGMTQFGGSHDAGVIYKLDLSTTTQTVVYDFDSIHGYGPQYNSLFLAPNGLLYGMTPTGGADSSGVLFSFNPSTNNYTVLLNFSLSDTITGGYSTSSFIQASNGLLYSMTSQGGYGEGAIISYDIATNKEAIVHNFLYSDGATPYGNLMQASNGLLYGMTSEGGTNNDGVVFSFNPSSGNDSVLFNFNNTNGYLPQGDLMQASDGLIYGMTYFGGTNNYGVIFRFNPSNGVNTVIYNFSAVDGESPGGGALVQDSNGLLYGLTGAGGSNSSGVLFSLNPKTLKYSDVYNFNTSGGGTYPGSSMIMGTDGVLYGTTVGCFSAGPGEIISYNPKNGHMDSAIFTFNGSNGAKPHGLLTEISGATGINNISITNNQIKLFPNPNNGVFTIQSSGISSKAACSAERLSVEIYNMLGEEIYTAKLSGANAQIDLSNNTSGIYLYRIVTETGELISTGKFIIQK